MSVPIDKLTIKAQEALQAAQQMTVEAGNPEVTKIAPLREALEGSGSDG